VSAAQYGAAAAFEVVMEVRLYRERPTPGHPAKAAAEALWHFLREGADKTAAVAA
jgi:hypothetical protein